MGAFLSLLGGLSKGAGEAYGDIDKQNRETKAKNDSLVAEALHKEMTTNEQLTPEQQDHLLTQYLGLRGIKDKKLIEGIKHAAGYHRQTLADMAQQAKPANDIQAPQQTTPEGMQLPPTAALPALPNPPYQPKSAGQLKFEESRGRVRQSEDDKAEAVREATRRAMMGTFRDKLDLFRSVEGTPYEDEARYMLQMAPRTAASGVAGSYVTGEGTRGKDLKEVLHRQGAAQSLMDQVDDDKLYTLVTGHDKTTVTNFYPKEDRVTGTGKEISGRQAKALGIKADLGGAEIPDAGTYTVLHRNAGGGIVGVIPTNQLQTYAERHNVKVVPDADGNIHAVPVTESTTTSKVPTGVAPDAAALPAMPQAPAGLSTTDTALGAGGTPRSAGAQGGTPATGGPPGDRIIGARPVEIPEGKIDKISGSQSLLIQAQTLHDLLPSVKNYTGPVVSRVFTSPLYNYAGGLGLPPNVNKFLTNMRELVATKAFERGGKTLPMSEQRIYTAQLPKESDTPQTLIAKMEILLPLIEKDYQNQLKGLTTNQRKKLTSQENVDLGGPVPTRPTPGTPAGKIKVTRKADGAKGTIDSKDFNPAKYDKRD